MGFFAAAAFRLKALPSGRLQCHVRDGRADKQRLDVLRGSRHPMLRTADNRRCQTQHRQRYGEKLSIHQAILLSVLVTSLQY